LSRLLPQKIAGIWRSRRCAVVFMAGLLWTAPSLLPAQVSLATVVDLAQRNSSAVKVAQADISKANAVLSETKDAIIPTVAFSTGLPVFPEVGFTGTPPSIWTTTVESLIFGVPQKHYITAARLGLQSATARLRDAREQAALDASTAYIELDTVNQELAVALQQQGFANRLVEIEKQRTEAGVDALSELLQAQLASAEIRLKVEHLQGRAGTLANTLSTLTGLPTGSISPDHASIPEIPQTRAEVPVNTLAGIESARLQASSKQMAARADREINYLPQLSFGAQYNRNTTLLNDVNSFFAKPLPANNFSSGIAIQVPIFDMGHWAKSRQSAADALRATMEAEQAQRQNDVQISELTGTIRELGTLAEIASLKQQIAGEQLKTVLTELELGNGGGANAGAPPQLSPKAEQLARIDERQKFEDSLDAGFDLARARLGLLRALGHMEDWLQELRAKP
jgi:outer membrane protein TolC